MKDGRVANQEVIQKASGSSAAVEVEEDAVMMEGEQDIFDVEADPLDEPSANLKKSTGKLVVEEEVQVGHVSWAAGKLLCSLPCSCLVLISSVI